VSRLPLCCRIGIGDNVVVKWGCSPLQDALHCTVSAGALQFEEKLDLGRTVARAGLPDLTKLSCSTPGGCLYK
jgi:hypothetical protein